MLHGRGRISRFASLKSPLWLQTRRSHPLVYFYQRRDLLTLAIETSCDDTAVAILETTGSLNHRQLSTIAKGEDNHAQPDLQHDVSREALPADHSQTPPASIGARILFHEKITARNTGLGGIHPIEALESHQANLAGLVQKAITFLPSRIWPDFVTVTRGPGMRSNLACGLDTAKGLAVAWQVPLVGVHHMQAHALTPRLVDALERGKRIQQTRREDGGQILRDPHDPTQMGRLQPDFPFLTLLVSGGHTMLVYTKGLTEHQIIATTRDVAIGDALDKCGRILLPEAIKSDMKDTAYARSLSDWVSAACASTSDIWPVPTRRMYEIEKPNNEFGWQVQSPLANTRDLAFSFSSIATNIERLFTERSNSVHDQMGHAERLQFARTALGISFEHLGSRTVIALENLRAAGNDVSTLVVSGGVAANSFLRIFLRSMLDARGLENVKLLFPPSWLCTDNAAMIGWTGMEMFEAGFQSRVDIHALRKWSMDATAADGGILGVGGWTQTGSSS